MKPQAEEETRTWMEPPRPSLIQFFLGRSFLSFFFLFWGGLGMGLVGFLVGYRWGQHRQESNQGVVCVSWKERSFNPHQIEITPEISLMASKLSPGKPLPQRAKMPTPSVEEYSFDHMQEQTIFNSFRRAILAFKENNDKGACLELKNIIQFPGYSGQWLDKALFLFGKNCYKK
jgi:hypothetical protein